MCMLLGWIFGWYSSEQGLLFKKAGPFKRRMLTLKQDF